MSIYIYIYPFPSALAKVVKERKQRGAEEEPIHPKHHTHLVLAVSCLSSRRNLPSRKKRSMGVFSGATTTGLPVYREYDDEELFETSSSISGDSDDEDQFSDGEEAGGAPEHHQFMQQAANSPAQQSVRRLNSDSLYDLSSMMAQLPVKKGLSKYYDGKSQSFACMSEVRCLEDLRKKETPYKKIKPSRSYVALDEDQEYPMPGAPNSRGIPKKPSGGSCANLAARNNSNNNMLYRPPPIPVNKSGYHQ